MAPVVTLSTGLSAGFELNTEGLFSTERTKMKLNYGIWPRVQKAKAVRLEPDVEAEMVAQARQRRSRTPVRKYVPVHEDEQMRSPSPIKRGVASARHGHTGIRTADVVGYKIVTDDANDMHAEFRIDVQMDRCQFTMHRRFNDFCDLHQMLVLQQPQCAQDVSLPPKRYFKRNKFDPAYLERRRRQLDAYLRELLSHDVFSRSLALRDFMSVNWHPPAANVNVAVGAEAAGRGERGGGGAGARAGGGGSSVQKSMTAMSPRQISIAIVRQRNARSALVSPPVKKPHPSKNGPPVYPRVRQLRAEPDFELLQATKPLGTPARGAESGSFVKVQARDFVAPASCRSYLRCPTIAAPMAYVADTVLT